MQAIIIVLCALSCTCMVVDTIVVKKLTRASIDIFNFASRASLDKFEFASTLPELDLTPLLPTYAASCCCCIYLVSSLCLVFLLLGRSRRTN